MFWFIALTVAQHAAAQPPTVPPTAADLLALDGVYCRSSSGVVYTSYARGWGVVDETGRGIMQSTSHGAERSVSSPATRRPGDGQPWRWSETIRFRTLGESPIRADLPSVFSCTDISDPNGRWVDLKSAFMGNPAPGETRCRSTSGAAWLSKARMAGIAPMGGEIMLSTQLVVDDLRVYSAVVVYGQPSESEVTVQALRTTELRAARPLVRVRQRLVFRRSDGSVLHDGVFTCESMVYPPMP